MKFSLIRNSGWRSVGFFFFCFFFSPLYPPPCFFFLATVLGGSLFHKRTGTSNISASLLSHEDSILQLLTASRTFLNLGALDFFLAEFFVFYSSGVFKGGKSGGVSSPPPSAVLSFCLICSSETLSVVSAKDFAIHRLLTPFLPCSCVLPSSPPFYRVGRGEGGS